MRASVQTNEVGRAAPLSAALHELGRPAGGNVRLLELGSSAGLNLWLDRYHISAGGSSWGPRDSPVQLHGHFSAGAPHSFGFQVTERRGCDLNPLDATKEHTRHLLQSFVWPEHLERFNRLNAAFRAASALQIDLSDAVVWLRDQLLARSRGSVTVVFHSVVLPYFAPEAQSELIDVIRTAGAEADADRPFAWLSLEPFGDMKRLELVSEEWPLGRRQRLAETTPHGTDVVWNPQPA
jgi:hypothetical protein